MKKIFLIVFILILIAVAAGAIFIFTFNADSYRPFFQQKLQEALKKPVIIQKISLGWNGGIALEVEGVTVLKDALSQEPLLRLDKGSVVVNAKPLLQREIQVSSIILESPEIDFVQNSDVPVIVAPSASETVSTDSSGAVSAAAMTFLVDEILIRNGRIRYADKSAKSPLDISVVDLDAAIRNISLTGPVDFDGKASLFSGQQNASFQGKLRVRGAGAFDIQNLLVQLQMETMDTAKILKSIPALQEVGLAQGLAGNADASIKLISIVDGNLKELEGEAHLTGGRFKTADMPRHFENAALDLSFSLNHIALQKFTGNAGSGNFAASGLAQNLQSPQPQTQAEVSLTGLQIADLAPPVSDREPHLEGVASLNVRGGALGTKDIEIRQTLNGNARINLQNGVLRNMNVIREIMNKLSMIPGVSQSLSSRLPEGYKEKLEARDTIFAPVEIPVTITQGVYFFDRAIIQSELFAIMASGKGDTLGNLQGEASLIIEPELSRAMMAGVNELQYLADSKGQLQVPLVIQSVEGKFTVIPNVSYVVSKLAASKTQEVLSSLLSKKSGTSDPNAQTQTQSSPLASLLGQNTRQNPSGSQPNQQQEGGGLLGQLLSSALQSQGASEGSSQQ